MKIFPHPSALGSVRGFEELSHWTAKRRSLKVFVYVLVHSPKVETDIDDDVGQ
jgi:hypothetical protein